jgi:hypothetical protein
MEPSYPWLAKSSFFSGIGLFVLALLVQGIGPMLVGPLPSWSSTVIIDLEVLGLLLAFFAPIIFGVVMPLVE